MTTINLTVTVELNDDLSAAEVSALASELVFSVSRSAQNEIKSVVRNSKVGLAGAVTVKFIDDEEVAATNVEGNSATER